MNVKTEDTGIAIKVIHNNREAMINYSGIDSHFSDSVSIWYNGQFIMTVDPYTTNTLPDSLLNSTLQIKYSHVYEYDKYRVISADSMLTEPIQPSNIITINCYTIK
jgi:hypothetical protein